MNISIVKNKYLNALFLLMLFSAIVHMVTLFVMALWTGNLYLLNYFNIVSSNQLSPDFFNSSLGNVISIIFIVILYLAILKINHRNN